MHKLVRIAENIFLHVPDTLGLVPADKGVCVPVTGLATGGVGVDLNLFLGLGRTGGFVTPLRFVYFLFTEIKIKMLLPSLSVYMKCRQYVVYM